MSMSVPYHGHGLAIENLQLDDRSEVQKLQEENEQLREEVRYLQHLLSIWQPQPCCLCQLHSSAGSSSTGASTRSSKTPAGSRSARDAAASIPAAVDRILRQQQVLIAQQQRQVLALQVELSSREQVVLESEALLAETSRRMAALAADAAQHTRSATSSYTPTATTTAAASRRLTSSSSSSQSSKVYLSRSSDRAAAGGGGMGGGSTAAGSVQQVYGLVLDQCRAVLTWCQEADGRISRAKAASAAQCRGHQGHHAAAARSTNRAPSVSTGGSSSSSKQPARRQAGPNPQQHDLHDQLQYTPAGGSSFLQCEQGSSLTVAGIARGEGLNALAAPAVWQLMQQLASLAAPLAALAVQMRSMILPAMPWIQTSHLGAELPETCAMLAQRSAAAAVQLADLCAQLPAAHAMLTPSATAAAHKARAQQAEAVAEAGSWASLSSQPQQQPHLAQQLSHTGDGAAWLAMLDAEDEQLVSDVAALLLCQHPNMPCAAGQTAAAAPARQPVKSNFRPTHTTSTRSSTMSVPGSGGAEALAGPAVLDRLQQRLCALGLKLSVLNDQLSFLAKCSAAQAKLMIRLAEDVLQALAAAVDAAEPPSLQEQRNRALHLTAQLQRAALLVQQQQQSRSAGSWQDDHTPSSVRAVVGLLENSGDVLSSMPEILRASSASTLKDAATAAVVTALNDFRTGLQPRQAVKSA